VCVRVRVGVRMCGVTTNNKISNEFIRGTVMVAQISPKMRERRLNWYGHVMRRDKHYVGRKVMKMEVPWHLVINRYFIQCWLICK